MRIKVELIESEAEDSATSMRVGVPARLIWWGSDCERCGNATVGSMTCDDCKASTETRALWVEQP